MTKSAPEVSLQEIEAEAAVCNTAEEAKVLYYKAPRGSAREARFALRCEELEGTGTKRNVANKQTILERFGNWFTNLTW